MFVVDLRHWMLPSGELAPAATLAPHMALVVECGTAVPVPTATAMCCRRHDARRPCSGHIAVRREESTIEWACSACDDSGFITGWSGTRWDLTEVDPGPPADEDDQPIYLPTDELGAVRELSVPSPTVRAALASAPYLEPAGACASLASSEIRLVLEAIAAATVAGRVRRRLDRAFGRLDHVRRAAELARRIAAH